MPPPTYTPTQRLTLFLVPRLASLLIRILGSTLRYEDLIAPGVTPGSQIPGPVVYAFWHRCLLSCAYYFRGQKIAILISRSFDGELIARTVERLGFIAIRGSSSRGGAMALKQIADEYGRGTRCAITADGPRGPNMVAKPGTAQFAQLVGTWVGTFYVLPLRAWELKTWDRFLIPKPFSRVLITWPPHVPAEDVTEQSVQANLDLAVAMTLPPFNPKSSSF
ncbi:lysophospholipid acyltransferase family protein [Granulicella aggregans]|uniref:lysophospholipid acyltransferase family protein n=1 Tax=Granulicella aggregans TaxID=474949 RepID=UPI0021DFA249|nr:lysophospholipid acyltransferase family protein [Granulicella aggregans]